jgi:endonuclease G
LNRGLWRKLENQTRKWSEASTAGVYVITGPVFNGPTQVLGNGVAIPTHVFKVVINRETHQGVGFIVPNTGPAKGDNLKKFQVTIAQVEQATGINFTPNASGVKLKNSIGKEFTLD